MLQQLLARFAERVRDLEVELLLQGIECHFYLVDPPALLVDRRDAPLEVDARLDRAKNLVAGAEHALEERELLRQKLEDALICHVRAVQEIDDHHIVLLSVAVTPADALL